MIITNGGQHVASKYKGSKQIKFEQLGIFKSTAPQWLLPTVLDLREK